MDQLTRPIISYRSLPAPAAVPGRIRIAESAQRLAPSYREAERPRPFVLTVHQTDGVPVAASLLAAGWLGLTILVTCLEWYAPDGAQAIGGMLVVALLVLWNLVSAWRRGIEITLADGVVSVQRKGPFRSAARTSFDLTDVTQAEGTQMLQEMVEGQRAPVSSWVRLHRLDGTSVDLLRHDWLSPEEAGYVAQCVRKHLQRFRIEVPTEVPEHETDAATGSGVARRSAR